MKYLAIDYGKKYIGLAISDSAGKVAMPFGIYDNNDHFAEKIKEVLRNNEIDEVVIGQSKNLEGGDNSIQEEIEAFASFISMYCPRIHFVNEVYTSMEAKWGLEKDIRRPRRPSKKSKNEERIDDKAATMILKTFLEKINN